MVGQSKVLNLATIFDSLIWKRRGDAEYEIPPGAIILILYTNLDSPRNNAAVPI